MHRTNRCGRREERGMALLLVVFLVILLGGLSLGLLEEGLAARTSLTHHESNLLALEVAEVGLVRAEAELRAQQDFGTDGMGFVSGTLGHGSYRVTCADDPVSEQRWILRAEGEHGHSVRRIEAGIRRRENFYFADALFAMKDLPLGGSTITDAYDSDLGTYASQAVNSDATGTYALMGGNVGSNANVLLGGSSVTVRGDAIAGPLHDTIISGSPTVTGDVMPRLVDFPMEPPPYEEFEAAYLVNNNLTIQAVGPGNSVRYNPGLFTLNVAGGATAVLSEGTYFFSDVTLLAGSSIKATGPVKIYVTGSFDVQSGASVTADRPGDVLLFAHPYPVPPGKDVTNTPVKINGGTTTTMAIYAPGSTVTFGGGNNFFGAAVGKEIVLSGNNSFHYDKALGRAAELKVAWIERLYWRDLAPPVR